MTTPRTVRRALTRTAIPSVGERAGRPVVSRLELLAAIVLGAFAMAWMARNLADWAQHWSLVAPMLGGDYTLYRDAAQRWLSGGGFYLPEQLTGPYPVVYPAILYPPTMLVLLVPFLWLPAVLWWAIPLTVIVWAVGRHRPRPIAIAIIGVCIAESSNWQSAVFFGNPLMWFVAALALATHDGWPAVFVILKPTLAPFALFGIRRRSWWLAAAALGVVSLALLPMWLDYLTVLRNAQGDGLLYSAHQVPAMLIPLAAWLGRRPTKVIARAGA